MHTDWSDFMLAIAALVGLLVVVVQFGFDLADNDSWDSAQDGLPEKDRTDDYKKAA